SAQIREILISESAWEEMTCLFAPSLVENDYYFRAVPFKSKRSVISFTSADFRCPRCWVALLKL
ncbi:hypothetical protein M8N57_22355, partial [Enterobacter kobei]|nr:hypothetical protein [Enterobacter kobei]